MNRGWVVAGLSCLMAYAVLANGAEQGGAPPAAVAHKETAAAPKETLEPGERLLEYGKPFGEVTLYAPAGKPKSVVIFLSGDGGWHLGVIDMARHLRDAGAAVVGIDVRRYLADVGASQGSNCRYMAADFETLAHRIERELGMQDYEHPLLYGYSSGATVVYAVLVESPPGTFGGAVSLGFCPDQKFNGVALCPGGGAKLTYHTGDKGAWVFDPAPKLQDRWVAFQGQSDVVCGPGVVDTFASQVGHSQIVKLPSVGHGFGVEKNWLPQFQQVFEQLSSETAFKPIASAEVSDLPLVEQPASGNPAAPLVVLLTGDGGWAGLDRGVAESFNARGIPVVALSTLRYYWHERTPEQSAQDVARVLRHYLATWNRDRVMLVGYSFGADVMPFIVNRLPADLRSRVQSVNLLGLSGSASFEIHVAGWVSSGDTGDRPLKPEIDKMQGVDALCLYGSGENNDPCAKLAGGSLKAQSLGEGHHFGGEYGELVTAMLQHAGIDAASQ